MKFYGKAEETAADILKAFKDGTVPAALAPIFITHNGDRYCARWSWLNQLLVALHGYSDARTYKGWQKVDRQVKKGEKAFYILEPVKVKIEDKESDEERIAIVGFKAGARFGIEQTDGEPLDQPEERQAFINSLPLLDVVHAWGIEISTYNGKKGAAHGVFRIHPDKQAIAVGVENLSTWCHELVHAADHRLGNLKEKGQHWRSETVAELGSCILLHMLGRPDQADAGGAWAYIQAYAQEAEIEPLTACVRVLERTCEAVRLILQTTETVNEKG